MPVRLGLPLGEAALRVMPPARLPFCCPLRAVGRTQSPGCRETLPRALSHRANGLRKIKILSLLLQALFL